MCRKGESSSPAAESSSIWDQFSVCKWLPVALSLCSTVSNPAAPVTTILTSAVPGSVLLLLSPFVCAHEDFVTLYLSTFADRHLAHTLLYHFLSSRNLLCTSLLLANWHTRGVYGMSCVLITMASCYLEMFCLFVATSIICLLLVC
jgi:hypothetical protein